MTFTQRLLTLLLYGIGTLFMAGFVHLVSVLAMPQLAPHDAFARLSVFAKGPAPVLLPQALPGKQITPFEDPALAEAVCIFDLGRGPLHVQADLDHKELLTLSFRSRTGRVFYAMTDKAAIKGKVDIMVMTAAQLAAAQANDDEDNPPQELRIVSPQATGFVLIKALAPYPSERAAAEARAQSVSCGAAAIAQN